MYDEHNKENKAQNSKPNGDQNANEAYHWNTPAPESSAYRSGAGARETFPQSNPQQQPLRNPRARSAPPMSRPSRYILRSTEPPFTSVNINVSVPDSTAAAAVTAAVAAAQRKTARARS